MSLGKAVCILVFGENIAPIYLTVQCQRRRPDERSHPSVADRESFFAARCRCRVNKICPGHKCAIIQVTNARVLRGRRYACYHGRNRSREKRSTRNRIRLLEAALHDGRSKAKPEPQPDLALVDPLAAGS